MTAARRTLDAINGLSEADFVAAFGDIAEHSPWVARVAAAARPFTDRAAMIAAFVSAVGAATEEAKRALLLAHPDLAGRAALAGALAPESASEQAGAGLDRLSAEEFARFHRLNDAYRARHGIPFIFAVRGATKHQILAAFEARLGNDPTVEFETALAQVGRIIRFRIEDRVAE
ncbi:2-oxo-4-hydroxy-4-carboxy-5-ureidoimidazoline decarboxylase [Prosthecomicrobium pneumaticum]|uniref:2-oxo-4-hydroxy-4-carboxy-5-ureidoimidazoline decarboxylase n=1 Tax=Prosthecomicrobium pneumaticum TaxID=81895 RepID=A0A7W9CSZ6_9HYPH|nr:2-oxo-4-hydroxy-4-carboxy-5-ureidoimidazoline decarboxylase [Prosthecomicrobium pneumaticum]MBB5751267.1 2-oxo-4-hydroxy-4-carboxy-5-ureidoimidazoline decarboxylase [Prosthecomicrobium pneumaticum]